MYLERLTYTPRLERVAAPTRITPPVATAIDEERQRIAASPNLFDGAILYCHRRNGEVLEVYPTTYATYLAACRLEGASAELGLGALGVGLIVGDIEGRSLWAKRSDCVLSPRHWAFPVVGSVDPADGSLEDALLREAREELGLAPADLSGLTPLAFAQAYGASGVFIPFSCELRPGTPLPPKGAEHTELAWAEDPEMELEPLVRFHQEVWRFRRSGQRPAIPHRLSRSPI